MDLDVPTQSTPYADSSSRQTQQAAHITSTSTVEQLSSDDVQMSEVIPPDPITPPRRFPSIQNPYPSPMSPIHSSWSTTLNTVPPKSSTTFLMDVDMDEGVVSSCSALRLRSGGNQSSLIRNLTQNEWATVHQLECLVRQLRYELQQNMTERNATISSLREQINVLASCLRGVPEMAAASAELTKACETVLKNVNWFAGFLNSSAHPGNSLACQALPIQGHQ
ncbi:hypothetical protein Moror_11422 [Moniliophthora roreri MCA 2997]|uniref:Uncharacterized protein n=2 Tax=Moniliophthora roreri TaxID=221103 RepID=V2WVB9_MONRO|nr:hypothetical protein Moror_11422 [Moniliophthora roreri MCA 2997]